MMKLVIVLGGIMGVALVGCMLSQLVVLPDNTNIGSGGQMLPPLALQLIHSGLNNPLDCQAPNDGTGRLFIVEKDGRIRISANGILQDESDAFLDIGDLVKSDEMEQGLLGMAFHPDFVNNGRFYVNYTAQATDDSMIIEYTVSSDPQKADPNSAQLIIKIDQPSSIHNGGQLQFGPDGMFYIGTGDGGWITCDPGDNAQDPTSPRGKILRLDVDNPPTFLAADNPFVNDPNTRDDIWAFGLRNPWRFCFDPQTNDLYIADVGYASVEEINIVRFDPADSPNFGWSTFEGSTSPPFLCLTGSGFEIRDPVAPVVEYSHSEGCSITGGYVYHGAAIPTLDGVYFYSDFCSGFIRAIRFVNGEVVAASDLTDSIEQIGGRLNNTSSFGLDANGELYVLDLDGDVFLLISP